MAGIITNNQLGGVPQSASKHTAMSTCFDVYGANSKQVGFINSITVNSTRTVTQIRHLNSVDAGIAVDTVVTPDAPTLQFNGFFVYNASNVSGTGLDVDSGAAVAEDNDAVGPSIDRIAGINLLMTLDQQQVPFDIVVRHVYLASISSASNTGNIVAVYKNCTISNMSIPINVGTAAVSDSGGISVGFIGNVDD